MEALAKRPHDPDLPRDRPAINCPLCRAEVDLSDQGIEALPSNFSASRLVETVQLQDKLNKNKKPKCDGCKEKDGIASCCDCGGFFLCSACCTAHKNVPATKNHTILPLDEFLQSKVPPHNVNKSPLCKKHPQEMLKLYCKNCEMLVCRDCALVTHRNHDYNFVDDVVEDEKKKLKEVTLKELETILKSTKEAIVSVKQMQSKVLSNNDSNVSMITDAFQKIIDMLNLRKNTLLKEVQQMTQDDLCPLQKQQDDLTALKQKIEQCRDFTKDTLQHGTNSEVMSARKQMLERTKILCDLHSSSSLSPVTTPSSVPFCLLDTVKEEINQVGTFVGLRHCNISETPKHVEMSETVALKVIIKYIKGQQISKAKSLITAGVTTGDLSIGQMISIDELGDGEYSLTFVPQMSGKHVIYVQIKGTHISNSPCHVEVYEQIIETSHVLHVLDQFEMPAFATNESKVESEIIESVSIPKTTVHPVFTGVACNVKEKSCNPMLNPSNTAATTTTVLKPAYAPAYRHAPLPPTFTQPSITTAQLISNYNTVPVSNIYSGKSDTKYYRKKRY